MNTILNSGGPMESTKGLYKKATIEHEEKNVICYVQHYYIKI